jgi:hypothetical protein
MSHPLSPPAVLKTTIHPLLFSIDDGAFQPNRKGERMREKEREGGRESEREFVLLSLYNPR